MFFILLLGLFILPVIIVIFCLYTGKLPADRIFYFLFWLFFCGVLIVPNYMLSFVLIGSNCAGVQGEKHCNMPIAQLLTGCILAMIESSILLVGYIKLPNNTIKKWIKRGVVTGFCLGSLTIVAKMLIKKFDIYWD